MHNTIVRFFKEPLVHFLLIGAGLFLLFHFSNEPAGDQPGRIVVTPAQVEQMEAKFTRTWMRPPTKEEMAGLITDFPVRIEEHRLDEVTHLLRLELEAQDLEIMRWHDMFPVMLEWVT